MLKRQRQICVTFSNILKPKPRSPQVTRVQSFDFIFWMMTHRKALLLRGIGLFFCWCSLPAHFASNPRPFLTLSFNYLRWAVHYTVVIFWILLRFIEGELNISLWPLWCSQFLWWLIFLRWQGDLVDQARILNTFLARWSFSRKFIFFHWAIGFNFCLLSCVIRVCSL